ncbi:MAG: thioredoxin domain-containing protein [Caldisericia bacterium]|nr:thioredoxin domain-containing protein [Caldisericia bacterium]
MKKTFLAMFMVVFALALMTQHISCSSTKGENSGTNNPITTPTETPDTSTESEVVETETDSNIQNPSTGTFAEEIASYGKPVMVDFGMESCVPCKMMVPILEELESKYPQDVKIIFVHVGKEQGKTKEFGIQMIPTQVFFDATGKELERHTGFISKEDILATFEKYGINITK